MCRITSRLSSRLCGKLIVLEGADGVGKTTLAHMLVERLGRAGVQCRYVSSPGSEEASLGKHIYALHHAPARFGIGVIDPAANQILHVAAHADAIAKVIRPALNARQCVILDRFWWSAWAYGRSSDVDPRVLESIIRLERDLWRCITPTCVFLVTAQKPWGTVLTADHDKLQRAYQQLAVSESNQYDIKTITNSRTQSHALNLMIDDICRMIDGVRDQRPSKCGRGVPQLEDIVAESEPRPDACALEKNSSAEGPFIVHNLAPVKTTPVYDTYWRFAAERQAVFHRRLRGNAPPWTKDPILQHYKFTNAYRASDRVSQYLIKHVLYDGDQSPREIFFRTILFKIFNRIETWQLLKSRLCEISHRDYSFDRYDAILSEAMASGRAVFSAAYVMPSGVKSFGDLRKHRNFLRLVELMMNDGVPERVASATRMTDAFAVLRSYPMIGDFLAYQFITDLNYSVLTDFTEMEFVVPGPGARSGLRKCFSDLGGHGEGDIIRMMSDLQETEFSRLGLRFESLWGRSLQLIDCQNLFCEVDKYARVAHPTATGIGGRSHIKQMYRPTNDKIEYWYPPKWGINELIQGELSDIPL